MSTVADVSTNRPARIIELRAGGPDDPDGSRTAEVLGAYFHAEHVRAFRRLLWPRLALVALIWLLVATMASLSGSTMFRAC